MKTFQILTTAILVFLAFIYLAGEQYKRFLSKRFEQKAQTLAKLTGWDIQDIRKKTKIATSDTPFWRNIWP